jgi:7,8-dihydropterin-6-yl-methyl-4-(beta-D-ribofuranosyl)aminobenzene 5'-phosphate synthase
MFSRTAPIACLLALAAPLCSAADKVTSLDVRLLSTMLTADEGYGEWGFAALVVADGHRILFDTGAHPDTVLRNARELHIDLSNVPDVILSHHHLDHTAGLVTLRREYAKSNPAALARAHVGEGIFQSRTDGGPREVNTMIATKRDYESAGGTFIEYTQPASSFRVSGSPGRSRASIPRRIGIPDACCVWPMARPRKTICPKISRWSL